MEEQDYIDSKNSCYSLAHTIAYNGTMQNKLVQELHDCEIDNTGYEKIIKAMLKVLLSNFT